MLERIKDKIITVDQALDLVKDDYQIVTGLGATEGLLTQNVGLVMCQD